MHPQAFLNIQDGTDLKKNVVSSGKYLHRRGDPGQYVTEGGWDQMGWQSWIYYVKYAFKFVQRETQR